MVRPKNRSLLYLILIAGAAALAIGVKTIVDGTFLNWTIQDFKLSLSNSVLSLGLINPTGSSFTVNSVTLDILDNGNRIATATYMGQLVILPMATTTLQLNLQIDPSGLLQLAFSEGSELLMQGDASAASQGTEEHDITVSGSANVDGIMVPVKADLKSFKV